MNTTDLYTDADVAQMQHAANARLTGKNRVEELKNYARLAGIKRIGIAHCVAVQREAEMLNQNLAVNFEVYAIDCKCGKIPNSAFLGQDAKGVSCNPAGQAAFLAQNQTELNISMGLCIGHDLVFNQKSSAPVTTLIVKDREFAHNPIQIFK